LILETLGCNTPSALSYRVSVGEDKKFDEAHVSYTATACSSIHPRLAVKMIFMCQEEFSKALIRTTEECN
jgi:hypothetical protein